jgi:hypothetical protein
LLAPIPPGQDAPPHITAAAVLANPEPFAAYYEVGWAPSAQAFEAMTVGFVSFVPLFWAAKLSILVLAATLCLGCALLAKRAKGNVAVALALAGAYAIGWVPAMGFYNFFAGIAFGVLGAALLAAPTPRIRDRALALPVFFVAAWAHLIAASMAGVFVFGVRWISNRPGTRLRTGLLDLATLAPAAGFAAVQLAKTLASAQDSGRVDQVSEAPARFFAHTFDTTFGGFSPIGWSLCVGVLCLALFAQHTRRNALVGGLLLATTALVALMPLHGLGWHFAKPRPAFFAFVAVPLLFRFRAESRAVVAITALAALSGTVSAYGNVREGIRIADAVAHFPTGDAGRVLEANFHPEPHGPAGPGIRSGVGIPHYATLGGGATPGAFATNPQIHSLSFVGGRALFPGTRLLTMVVPEACRDNSECYRGDHSRADHLALTAVHWDSVALVDPPPEVLVRLVTRGFVADGWLLRPRVADARIHLPDGAHGPMVWRFGYPDTLGVFEEGEAVVQADGAVIRATDIPAGPTRVQLFIDSNEDGEHQAAEMMLIDREETLLAGEPTDIQTEFHR